MKRTISALTALLACTALAQDAGPASDAPVWRVVIAQTTIVEPGEPLAVRSLTLDVPDDQCRIGTVKANDHRGRRESDKNIKLCVGKIDGLPTLTGLVMPVHIQQALAAGKYKPDVNLYESFSFGFDGTKAVLQSETYKVSIMKLNGGPGAAKATQEQASQVDDFHQKFAKKFIKTQLGIDQ